MTSLDVEDSGPFGLLHDRLRGNFEVAPDPHVNCEELEQVFQVITHFAPSLFPSLGMKRPKRKLGFAWARTSLCPREITLKVNLEANPIVVLGKILTIMEKMRGCRAASHEVKPYSSRIQQRIHTLEKMLNGYVDVGHFDDANDEDAFKVWDRVTQRVRRDDIAREVWPKDYKKDLSYPGGPLMQRIRDYKDRVDGWIEEYSSLIRQTTIAIPPKK